MPRTEDLKALAAARLRAAHLQPYLASGLFAMVPVRSPGLGTLAVDKYWRLYFDPVAIHRWGTELLAGVLLHEVAHLVRDHAGRATHLGVGPTSHQRWNVAADCAINDDLTGDGIDLPDGGLQPTDFDLPVHQSVEIYFAMLGRACENAEQTGADEHRLPGADCSASTDEVSKTVDCGSGCDGTPRRWDLSADGTPGVDRATAETLRRRIASAVNTHRGNVPAGWQRWADAKTRPAHNWRRELRSIVTRTVRTGPDVAGYSTWSRPSRRQSAYGEIIMPAHRTPSPTIAVVIDTSASINDAALAQAVTELRAIVATTPGPHWLLCADAMVQSVTKIRSVADIELQGGGGTDLRAALKALSGLHPRPKVAVVLTDGLTPWPDRPPRGIATIVATTDRPAPRGFRTVHLAV